MPMKAESPAKGRGPLNGEQRDQLFPEDLPKLELGDCQEEHEIVLKHFGFSLSDPKVLKALPELAFVVSEGSSYMGRMICSVLLNHKAGKVVAFDVEMDPPRLLGTKAEDAVRYTYLRAKLGFGQSELDPVFRAAMRGRSGNQVVVLHPNQDCKTFSAQMDRRETERAVLLSTEDLIEACKHNGVGHMVMLSSLDVLRTLDGVSPVPVLEPETNSFEIERRCFAAADARIDVSQMECSGRVAVDFCHSMLIQAEDRLLNSSLQSATVVRTGTIMGMGEEQTVRFLVKRLEAGLFDWLLVQPSMYGNSDGQGRHGETGDQVFFCAVQDAIDGLILAGVKAATTSSAQSVTIHAVPGELASATKVLCSLASGLGYSNVAINPAWTTRKALTWMHILEQIQYMGGPILRFDPPVSVSWVCRFSRPRPYVTNEDLQNEKKDHSEKALILKRVTPFSAEILPQILGYCERRHWFNTGKPGIVIIWGLYLLTAVLGSALGLGIAFLLQVYQAQSAPYHAAPHGSDEL
eukprot:Clim_evm52s77 gene=Clim_evmTU52s77